LFLHDVFLSKLNIKSPS